MKTYYIYHMHIIDNEFDSEYDFDGYFKDHFEAARFMEENEAVGNIITMRAPFITEAQMSPEGLPRI